MSTYTIPNVVRTHPRGDRVMDVYSHLLSERIVYLGTEIDDGVSNALIAQILHLESEDADRPIDLYINSPGGSLTATLRSTTRWSSSAPRRDHLHRPGLLDGGDPAGGGSRRAPEHPAARAGPAAPAVGAQPGRHPRPDPRGGRGHPAARRGGAGALAAHRPAAGHAAPGHRPRPDLHPGGRSGLRPGGPAGRRPDRRRTVGTASGGQPDLAGRGDRQGAVLAAQVEGGEVGDLDEVGAQCSRDRRQHLRGGVLAIRVRPRRGTAARSPRAARSRRGSAHGDDAGDAAAPRRPHATAARVDAPRDRCAARAGSD